MLVCQYVSNLLCLASLLPVYLPSILDNQWGQVLNDFIALSQLVYNVHSFAPYQRIPFIHLAGAGHPSTTFTSIHFKTAKLWCYLDKHNV